jgi:LmbE family N-acetylglucosaminyl deacetylase
MLARIMAAGVVIMSPHFDDAVLSCWSVLTGLSDVAVVNFFTGAPPAGCRPHEGEALTGASDPAVRVRERAEEDRAALSLVGVQPRNLGLLEHPRSAGRNRFARRRRSAKRLRELLGDPHLDGASHVYAPAGLGGHPDHELVRELGCLILREGRRVSFYADQPYCYAYGWPHWVTGDSPDPYLDVDRHWRGYLVGAGASFHELRADAVALGASHERKLQALRLYRTQFAMLEGGANRRVSNPALTGWEVFWHPPVGQPEDSASRRRARRR